VCATVPTCCTNLWTQACASLVNPLGCGVCPEETNCTDNVDEDSDALTDCADGDCELDAACYEHDCDNGSDDDGDGQSDCDDGDCWYATACGGIGHNCCAVWGGVGCSDPAIEACVCDVASGCCSLPWSPICVTIADAAVFGCGANCTTESDCDDGVDNDSDAFTDCDDDDCAADPACQGP
jgi:hypothetical protein